MNSQKVSVIVAIYNAEKTLIKCLTSIREQSHQNIEVLMINDGSKDGSGEICRRYAKVDSRFRFFEKDNEGVALTRQMGMDNASGEWILNVDPDDWIEPTMIEEMLHSALVSNSELALCDYNAISKEGSRRISQRPKELTSKSIMDGILDGSLLGGLCNKLLHKDLIYKKFNWGGGGINLNLLSI